MAFVTPTNDQKQLLQYNDRFKQEVKWAVLALALFWKNNQGTGLATQAETEKWARHRVYSVNNILNDVNNVSNQIDQWSAAFAVRLADHQIWDNAVTFNADTVINYMKSQNKFEAIANVIFEQKVQGIIL